MTGDAYTEHVAKRAANLALVHVVLSLDAGGLERLAIDLVREGASLGQRVSVVCLERPGRLVGQAEAAGAEVHCVHKRPGLRFGIIPALAKLFGDCQSKIVHTHQIGALFYAGPAARRAGVPIVVHTEHGKHYSQRLRTRWLGRQAGRYAHKFCCVSQDIADETLKARIVPRDKIAVVANGIDTARFSRRTDTAALRLELGIPGEAKVVGTIGRLDEIKRQDLLIRAFASLVQNRPEAHLVIVGDGPLREQLMHMAESFLPAGQYHFAGYQNEPERYLQLMDVFALTSRSEGMPLAILEAWAAGVPVVASSVGGVPELVRHEQTGLLFESGDEAAIVKALELLLSDAGLAKRLRSAAGERVNDEFSLLQTVRAYQRHYNQLLGVSEESD